MDQQTVLFSNKSLMAMIIPLFLEQLLIMLVGMADTLVVSYAGEAAVSGVSLVNQFKGPISSWQNMATVSTTFSFRHLLLTRLFVMTGVSFAVGARKLSGINIRRSIYSAAMMVFRFMMLWVYWTENRSMKLLS